MKLLYFALIASIGLSCFHFKNTFAQCTPVSVSGTHCDGQRAIFPMPATDAGETIEWYQDAGGTVSDGTLIGASGQHVSRLDVELGVTTKNFWARRTSLERIGSASGPPPIAGSIQVTSNAFNKAGDVAGINKLYEMEVTPAVDFTLNDLSIWVKAYQQSQVYGLRIRVVLASEAADNTKGTYSDWHKFAGGNSGGAIKATIPGDIKVPAGGPYLVQILSETDPLEGVAKVDEMYYNTTVSDASYLTAPYNIDFKSVPKYAYNSTTPIFPVINDWNITVNCPMTQLTSTLTTAGCCVPVKNISLTAPGTGENTSDFPLLITAQGPDANSSYYYEWYDQYGLLIPSASGTGKTTYTATSQGSYKVKVVRQQTDLDKISCYKESFIRLERSLFNITAQKVITCQDNASQLKATTNGLFQGWTTLDDEVDNIETPGNLVTWVTPTQPTTYLAKASYQLGNLISNPDFEGTGGYSSDYIQSNTIETGKYAVGTNPRPYNPYFVTIGDHTSGTGKMYIVDADQDNNKAAYKTTVQVKKDVTYAFSFWIANIHLAFSSATPDTNGTQASKIQFVINNLPLIKVNTQPDNQWRQYVQTYTAPADATFEIALRNNANPSPLGGNDFALDDIIFAPLSPSFITDTVFVRPCVLPCNQPAIVSITSSATISGTGANKSISICQGAITLPSLEGAYTPGPGTNKYGYKYAWYKKNSTPTYVNIGTVADKALVESEAGTWVLRVEDYNGISPIATCYREDSIKFVVAPLPGAPSAKDTSYCQGVVASPLKATPVASNTLTWYDAAINGNILSGGQLTPSTATAGSPASSYWVSQKTPANLGACEGPRALVRINVIAKPGSLIATAPTDFCEGTSAPVWTASADAGNSLVWYSVATGGIGSSTVPSIPNTPAGTKTVYVSQKTSAANGSCESDRTKIEVKVLGGMTAGRIDSNQTICQDGTVVPKKILSLSAATGGSSPPIQYSWESSPNGTSWTSIAGETGLDYTPTQVPTADIYYRRVAKAGTQQCDYAESDPVKMTVIDPPVLELIAGQDQLCEDSESPFTAALSTTPGPNTLPILSYIWKSISNTPTTTGKATLKGASTNTATFVFSSTATTGESDQATISVEGISACGTTAPITKLVTIKLRPRDFVGTILGSESICETTDPTEVKTFAVSTQTNTTNYSWTLGSAPELTGTQPFTSVSIPVANLVANKPTATLKLVLQNACGLGVSRTKSIVIVPAEPIKSNLTGKQQICLPTDAVQFVGSTSNGGAGATFEFNVVRANGTIGKTQAFSTIKTFDIVPGDVNDGDKIRLIVQGDPTSGCFSSAGLPAELVLDTYNYPDTTVTNNLSDSICAGRTINLCVKTDKNNTTFEWYKDGIVVGNTSCTSISRSSQSGLYTVRAANGVCSPLTSLPRSIKVYDQPSVKFTPDYILLELLETPFTKVSASVSDLFVDPIIKKEWASTLLLSDFSTDSLNATFTSPSQGGDYYYSLTVMTGGGSITCPSSGQIHIKALPPVRVPNAISPNGDGLNETWQIDGIDTYSNAKVYLYNRWGTKIFEAGPYGRQNEWDGTSNGVNLPTGTYYYIIDLHENLVKQSKLLTGSLTIVR